MGFSIDPVRAFLPPRYWRRKRDYFGYGVEYNTLAASAVASEQQFQVQADADFFCLSISAIEATTTAGTTEQTYWPIVLNIFDSTSGSTWFNTFVHLNNVAGRMANDGRGPHQLEFPRLVEAAGAVTVQLTNLEATARRIWILFHGCKIWREKIQA